MFKYKINITLLIWFFMIILFFIVMVNGKKKRKMLSIINKNEDIVNSYLVESISNVDTVKGSHLEKRLYDQFSFKYQSMICNVYKYSLFLEKNKLVREMIRNLLLVLVYASCSYLVIKNKIGLGEIIVFQSFFMYFVNSCSRLIELFDEYYDYCYGELEYRSLRFETEILDMPNYQGVAGMNFTDSDTPYTRIVEHKHFEFDKGNDEKTVITKEYSATWKPGDEPYYSVNDDRNNELYRKYKEKAENEQNVIFAGRLGQYQYFDMDKVINSVLELTDKL